MPGFLLRLALVVGVVAGLAVVPGGAAQDVETVTADADSYHLTLVTGEVVQVERSAEGRWAVTVAAPAGQQPPRYQTIEDGEGFYVIPEAASPWIGERLDPELFNVPALVEQGYHDGARGDLPVILTFRDQPDELPPSFRAVRDLDSIGALAAEQDKDLAIAFGDALRDDPDALFAAVDRVWLDRSVGVALELTRDRGRTTATATLTDRDGTGLAGRTVRFTADGHAGSATTDPSGVAVVEIPPAHGRPGATVEARFPGDAFHTPATAAATVPAGQP